MEKYLHFQNFHIGQLVLVEGYKIRKRINFKSPSWDYQLSILWEKKQSLAKSVHVNAFALCSAKANWPQNLHRLVYGLGNRPKQGTRPHVFKESHGSWHLLKEVV